MQVAVELIGRQGLSSKILAAQDVCPLASSVEIEMATMRSDLIADSQFSGTLRYDKHSPFSDSSDRIGETCIEHESQLSQGSKMHAYDIAFSPVLDDEDYLMVVSA
jgi:hypothetical protein